MYLFPVKIEFTKTPKYAELVLPGIYRKLVRPSPYELVPNISRHKFNNL